MKKIFLLITTFLFCIPLLGMEAESEPELEEGLLYMDAATAKQLKMIQKEGIEKWEYENDGAGKVSFEFYKQIKDLHNSLNQYETKGDLEVSTWWPSHFKNNGYYVHLKKKAKNSPSLKDSLHVKWVAKGETEMQNYIIKLTHIIDTQQDIFIAFTASILGMGAVVTYRCLNP